MSARALFSLGEILEVASPNPEKESVEILSRGIKLAPETEAYRATRAILLARLARYPEAEESAAQEPNEGYRLAAQALVAQAEGDRMRSAKVRDELIAKYGDRMAGFISLLFAYQGENDQAFLWLDRATQQRDRYIPWFKNHFGLGNLHADPRWPVFLAKLGLTDEQLK